MLVIATHQNPSSTLL